MGTTALTVVQFGKETTWGTATTATAIWSAIDAAKIKPIIVNTQRKYLTGTLYPAHAVARTHSSGQASLGGDFTFEDFIYVLLSGVKGAVTPTGATTAKTWTFPFPTTASGAVEGRTLEFHDGQQEYELAGGVVESFSLVGDAANDGIVKFTSNWIGKGVTAGTKTASLAVRTYDLLPAAKMKLYVDDIAGTIGATQSVATLVSWSWDVKTGVHLKQFQDGAISPSTFGYAPPELTLKLTLEFNANGVTEMGKYIAGTGRLIKLYGEGALITGTTYRSLDVQLAGDITDVGELWGDRDGNTIIEVTLKPRYDAGAFAQYAKVEIVNAVAAVAG